MTRGVLLGLIAVVCWSLTIGIAGATDVTPMAKGGGKGPALKAPAPVARTGQDISYATGDDGDLQKGVPWRVPRFTDNGNGTVTDNLTGLMWLKDANCIFTNYPEFDNVWLPADGRVDWQQGLDFVAGIKNGTYPNCGAGYTDWRLPNIKELLSLMDYDFSFPCLSNAVGTQQFTYGDPFYLVIPEFYDGTSDYLTSTSDANGPVTSKWNLNFIDCELRRGGGFGYVWPVRGGK